MIGLPVPAPTMEKYELRFRARLRERWITCAVTSGRRRLGDVLNRDESTGVAVFDDVAVDDGDADSGAGGQRAPFAAVNLANVLFAIPIEEGARSAPDYHDWVRKRPERVQVAVGPFRIEGELYVVEDGRLRDVVALARPQFIALARATVRQEAGHSPATTCDVVYVNRRLLDFLAPAPTPSSD